MSGLDDEVESTFGISEELVQSPVHKAATTSSVDFDGLLQKPLKVQEDLKEGNGGQMWPAGRRLAKYILMRKRESLRGCSMFA